MPAERAQGAQDLVVRRDSLHASGLTCGHGNGEAHANEGVGEGHDGGDHAHQPDPACMRTCSAGEEPPMPAHILHTAKLAGV